MRQLILQHYIYNTIERIIYGHWIVHIRRFFVTIGGFLFFALARYGMIYIGIDTSYKTIAFGLIGIVWYIYTLIQFMQEYLRVVIISPDALIIMHREGLMEYNIQQIERETIESISYKQDSLGDSILMAGDIVVSFEHLDSYVIHTVYKPKYISQELFLAKKKYEKHIPTPIQHAVHDHVSDEKFGLLVETLGEVIKDYMGRK